VWFVRETPIKLMGKCHLVIGVQTAEPVHFRLEHFNIGETMASITSPNCFIN
jgi:hypothetical protein